MRYVGAMADAPSRKDLERWLRSLAIDELCVRVDPFEPGLADVLYDEPVTRGTYDAEADAAEAARHGLDVGFHSRWLHARRLRDEGRTVLVGGPWLASEAPTPFELDGRHYASVAAFYAALKLRDDDPEREAVARGRGGRSRRIRPAWRDAFEYDGRRVAIGSPMHGGLVARATEAKVAAHAEVRRALATTGRSLLYMGGRYGRGPQALGRYMPFALMVLRLRHAG